MALILIYFEFIQVEPETAVAWQGLAMLFETHPDTGTSQEGVTVYTKLVQLVNTGDKHVAYLNKLAAVHLAAGDALAAADVYLKLMPIVKEAGNKTVEKELAQKIVKVLAPIQDQLPVEKRDYLLSSLGSLLSDSVLGNNETNYKLYLSLVYKTGNFTRMYDAALKMAAIFPTAYPLEWIARLYVEDNLPWKNESASNSAASDNNLSWNSCLDPITRLLKVYSTSLWGNLAVGLQEEKEGRLVSAVDRYSAACQRSLNSFSNTAGQPIIWWRLLVDAQRATKDWPAVESTLGRVVTLLSTTEAKWPGSVEDQSKDDFLNHLKIMRAEALMQLGHEQHFITALDLLRKLTTCPSVSSLIVECLLQLYPDEARKELEKLQQNNPCSNYDFLTSKLMYIEQNFDGAKSVLGTLLANNPSDVRSLVLLGRIQQELGDHQASLNSLLRAAKHDSTNGQTFLFLGHHYRYAGDKTKASKCYQKAYALSPVGEEEGAALSDIYRDLGEHDKNYALLQAATQNRGGAWAWLRLGLHFLAQHEPQSAISALQRCLQLQQNNMQALESLGDAYLARGSYVAAQKVHERVLLHDPTAVYPRCQIAKIQLCVGEPLNAIAQYEAALQYSIDEKLVSVSYIGMAQAHIVIASNNALTNHLENTLSHCVLAVKSLDKARELQPNSVSVWKLLGEACCLLHKLPQYLKERGVLIPARLVNLETDAEAMTRADLSTVLQLASKCFSAAVQLNQSDDNMWHDLGLSYYLQAKHLHQQEGTEYPSENVVSFMNRATTCLKKSLHLSPLSSETWNTLGIVSVDKTNQNLALAQHCFIRSTQLKPSPRNWTHLGAFYIVCNKIQLAHQAFSQAQALDPKFVNCWTGQALVAESVQHYDAADLFRHCCTLGVHPESCTGHAHHVMLAKADCKTVSPSVMALAADAMMYYSRQYDEDALELNLAGLCLEESGMMSTAASLYSAAIKCSTRQSGNITSKSLTDCIRTNCGRVLTAMNRIDEAVEIMSAISEPNFQTECILALACLKKGDFEAGYTKYMSALHWLAQNHYHKANVLVALACLQYKFKKTQDAKTILFESCSEGGGCVAGILALGALGLVEGDATLISAAINELQPYKHIQTAAHHVAFLDAAQAIVNGNVREAKNILCRAILCHPQKPELWRFLSWHLITAGNKAINPSSTSRSKKRQPEREVDKLSQAIVSCSRAAATLTQHQSGVFNTVPCHGTATQDGCTLVLGYLQAGDHNTALKEAQRTLIMHPASSDAWAALVAAARATNNEKHLVRIAAITRVWKPRCSEKVKQWLSAVAPHVA